MRSQRFFSDTYTIGGVRKLGTTLSAVNVSEEIRESRISINTRVYTGVMHSVYRSKTPVMQSQRRVV